MRAHIKVAVTLPSVSHFDCLLSNGIIPHRFFPHRGWTNKKNHHRWIKYVAWKNVHKRVKLLFERDYFVCFIKAPRGVKKMVTNKYIYRCRSVDAKIPIQNSLINRTKAVKIETAAAALISACFHANFRMTLNFIVIVRFPQSLKRRYKENYAVFSLHEHTNTAYKNNI